MLKVIDLFSGIGGFSLGLERTGGFTTTQFVEFDAKARQVLKKHWPDVPQHDDIRTYQPTLGAADVVCGGFPCQDISSAGRGVGIIGERSGLWSEMARVVGAVRPQWVIAENVSALRSKGLALVLQDLDALGYDAEWHCIPASAVGAPHQRDRIWVVAYAKSARTREDESRLWSVPNGCSETRDERAGEVLAHTTGKRLERATRTSIQRHLARFTLESETGKSQWWTTEPNVGRVAHGVSGRVDRIKQLGNAIVPQIATLIGQQIVQKASLRGQE